MNYHCSSELISFVYIQYCKIQCCKKIHLRSNIPYSIKYSIKINFMIKRLIKKFMWINWTFFTVFSKYYKFLKFWIFFFNIFITHSIQFLFSSFILSLAFILDINGTMFVVYRQWPMIHAFCPLYMFHMYCIVHCTLFSNSSFDRCIRTCLFILFNFCYSIENKYQSIINQLVFYYRIILIFFYYIYLILFNYDNTIKKMKNYIDWWLLYWSMIIFIFIFNRTTKIWYRESDNTKRL